MSFKADSKRFTLKIKFITESGILSGSQVTPHQSRISAFTHLNECLNVEANVAGVRQNIAFELKNDDGVPEVLGTILFQF